LWRYLPPRFHAAAAVNNSVAAGPRICGGKTQLILSPQNSKPAAIKIYYILINGF
jgi:hypothetical protein